MIARKIPGNMKRDIRADGGQPGGKGIHVIRAVVYSGKDKAGYFYM